MPQFCTCGAELPPDARFCHKCGKPQRAEAAADTAAEQVAADPAVFLPPNAAPPLPRPELSFHNPVAVRVGLSMACGATLLSSMPVIGWFSIIWWVAAGFCAVYLYRRRTGEPLTVRKGLRMGWITGVFTFAMMTVIFTLAAAAQRGGLAAIFQQQLQNLPSGYPNVEEIRQILQTPAGLATVTIFGLAASFAITTSLCTAGGALGAKIVGRD
jgi:hypothetical protein